MRFDGKTAMVTGAGRGIGRAIALRLAREGADVAVCDIDTGAAERVAGEVIALGRRGLGVDLDVASRPSVDAAVETIARAWGGIDFLVNNAGITIGGAVVDFAESDWDRMIEINLKGVLRCSQAVARRMIARGSGKIVNVASESGKTAKPLFAVYATTKFAVVGLTQGLAQELAPHRINVNAVCPGIVRTQMWEELDRTLARLQGLKEGEALERRRLSIPLGRLEEPEEVAGVTAFLLSPDADYMTGQSVNVTGGREFH